MFEQKLIKKQSTISKKFENPKKNMKNSKRKLKLKQSINDTFKKRFFLKMCKFKKMSFGIEL